VTTPSGGDGVLPREGAPFLLPGFSSEPQGMALRQAGVADLVYRVAGRSTGGGPPESGAMATKGREPHSRRFDGAASSQDHQRRAPRRHAGRVLDRLGESERSWWWVTFGFVALMGAAWGLVSPLTAPPDEASHVITAVAVAHGQLIGSPLSPMERQALASDPSRVAAPRVSAFRSVTVPKIYGKPNPECFSFRREVPASCLKFRGSRTVGNVVTPTMWYPPAYYAWVGLISSPFSPGPVAVYVMRLASTALFAMLIASGAASLRRTAGASTALAGLLVALTPTAFYFGASINPNGLEIAAGIAMWSSGIVLVRESTASVDTRLVVRFAVATGLLILARHPGPTWAGLIALVLLVLATPDARKRLGRAAPVRWAIAGVSACFGAALVWIVIARPFSFAHQVFDDPLSISAAVRSAVGNSGGWLEAMIGSFGTDTPAPFATFGLWLIALGGLAFTAIIWGSSRDRGALLLLGATAISIPIILAAIEGTQIGMHWQARYQLPFAVGVPILAATSVGSAKPHEPRGTGRLATGLGVLTATAGLLAFAQVLRRYTVGYDGPIQFWKHPPWSPPISSLILLAVFAALTVGWVSWILRPRHCFVAAGENAAPASE
jgi:Predicted membrane protein (DUF2142)